MKKVMLLAAGLFLAMTTFAQAADNKPTEKKIEVTGSSEIEITPDEIYFQISLKEYLKGKTKVEITELEKQLQKAVVDAGIPKENLTVENVSGYNYDWLRKKKNPLEFMASKQYRLKLNKLDKINIILGAVDAEGIESTRITSYTSSKMEEYRKEAKIKALQAAKTKADYMVNAIGEKLGGILEIQEINTDSYSDVHPMAVNMYAKSADAMGGGISDIDFKTIKVRGEVRAVFSIK
ncbi:MAG: SIMPL domain-containing protein [Chitinophaga sp.]|uniref:SIMPL domain-containing protein n=1 Tax=Chitinophaga sp. TaxID=1869181 RepID=UPI0025B99B84|nr:SIMPL domain-containing protein [Chitinophaga sp.]MBV8255029.1 SIMPL domain-containing protein [Chitinophaga sp.]